MLFRMFDKTTYQISLRFHTHANHTSTPTSANHLDPRGNAHPSTEWPRRQRPSDTSAI